MGLTPLEGLVMGTRSGDVDPGLHDYLARQSGLTLSEITAALNREIGPAGPVGVDVNDMRELEAAAAHRKRGRTPRGRRVRLPACQDVAGMAVALGRVDGLVFTGGIGENSATIRAATWRRLAVLGFELDEAANIAAVRGQSGPITRGRCSGPGGEHQRGTEIARETSAVWRERSGKS